MRQIVTIAINTFLETIRQSFFSIILFIFIGLIAASPTFTMFTLMESLNVVIDTGLASILLCSLLISAFSASTSVTLEIEKKTALTILSKPIHRAKFIMGKAMGLLLAVFVAVYILSITLIITVRIGVPDAAWQRIDNVAIGVMFMSLFLAFLFACFVNYFYDKPFQSALVLFLAFFYTIGIIFLLFIGPGLEVVFAKYINLEVVKGCILVAFSSLILSSVALAIATRLNLILTILATTFIFIIGLVSDFVFGAFRELPLLALFYAVVPNLQIFWVADMYILQKAIPLGYILNVFLYTLLYVSAMTIVSILLFEEREI
jgi:hypothetical protein